MKKGWGQASGLAQYFVFPWVLWHCWLGDRKDFWPLCHLFRKRSLPGDVKKENREGKQVTQVHFENWGRYVMKDVDAVKLTPGSLLWCADESCCRDWSAAWCWQGRVCEQRSGHKDSQSTSDPCCNVEWTIRRRTAWCAVLKLLFHFHYSLLCLCCIFSVIFNPLTAIFPKMPVPKPILDTTQILFATILFVCFDNCNTYCSQFVTHLHFFIDRNLGSSHPSVPAVPWTG